MGMNQEKEVDTRWLEAPVKKRAALESQLYIAFMVRSGKGSDFLDSHYLAPKLREKSSCSKLWLVSN